MGSRPTSPKQTFWLEGGTVIFPWFNGEEAPKNRKGDRNFGLTLSKEQADALAAADYNVKTRKAAPATDEYEERPEQYFITCKLGYNGKTPPRVVMITCKTETDCKRTALTEETISLLDTANITKVDCKISPYDWGDAADGGRTAYVQSLFVTVELDRFDEKYDNMPWSHEPVVPPPGDDANE